VSGRQVTTGVLSAQVLAATDAAEIDPARLILEMTERVLIDVADQRLDDLDRLTAHGVRLAIDDFGTGYSSLTYLKNMPVDIVKIDRSFTAGLGVDESDRAIVEAVATLACTLGLGTVAEGVEDATQRETLHRLGCQYAQGFYFARPLPADDIEQRLHAPCASPRASRTRGYRLLPTAS
jgi:EAL domain-containing protein (putative c-di-GMP-specific phosphodiesterase class I)